MALINRVEGNYAQLDRSGGEGTRGETLVTNTPDPWRDYFLGLIGNQASSTTTGKIPDFTTAALENFTKNPSAAASFFPQLAAPLLNANRDAQAQQTTALMDMFRKAGGTGAGSLQSGAFAQAGKQLVNDFARQDQEILAKNYVPLTGQLSENMTNAIRLGLAVPGATSDILKSLVPLGTSLDPLQTRTQQSGVTQNIVGAGGQDVGAQQAQIDQAVRAYMQLNQPSGRY